MTSGWGCKDQAPCTDFVHRASSSKYRAERADLFLHHISNLGPSLPSPPSVVILDYIQRLSGNPQSCPCWEEEEFILELMGCVPVIMSKSCKTKLFRKELDVTCHSSAKSFFMPFGIARWNHFGIICYRMKSLTQALLGPGRMTSVSPGRDRGTKGVRIPCIQH